MISLADSNFYYLSARAELENEFLNVNNIESMIPVAHKNITAQLCRTGQQHTAATQALNTSCIQFI